MENVFVVEIYVTVTANVPYVKQLENQITNRVCVPVVMNPVNVVGLNSHRYKKEV